MLITPLLLKQAALTVVTANAVGAANTVTVEVVVEEQPVAVLVTTWVIVNVPVAE